MTRGDERGMATLSNVDAVPGPVDCQELVHELRAGEAPLRETIVGRVRRQTLERGVHVVERLG